MTPTRSVIPIPGGQSAVIAVAVLAAIGLLFISPALALIPVVLLLLPAIFRLTTLAALTFLAMLFSSSLEVLTGNELVASSDEVLLVALLVAVLISRARRGYRRIPGTAAIIGFLIAGALSSAVNLVPFPVATLAAFVLLKGWLLAFAFAQLDWTPHLVKSAATFAAWITLAGIIATVVNVLIPGQWSALWGTTTVEVRFGIVTAQGLFSAPILAGNAMACAVIVILAYALVNGFTWVTAILLAGAGAGVAFSGRRTATLGAIAAAGLVGVREKAASAFVIAIVAVPLGIAAAWSAIEEAWRSTISIYVARDDTARAVLHRDMWQVAAEHFPFGAGFGRFGSYVAGADYSPEYIARGYQYVWGLHENTGNSAYLFDTQWPAIIAEPGFIGAAFAIAAIAAVAWFAWKLSRSEDRTLRWLSLATIGMTALLLVASFGLPVFFGSSPPQAIYFAVLGALVGVTARSRETAKLNADQVDVIRKRVA